MRYGRRTEVPLNAGAHNGGSLPRSIPHQEFDRISDNFELLPMAKQHSLSTEQERVLQRFPKALKMLLVERKSVALTAEEHELLMEHFIRYATA